MKEVKLKDILEAAKLIFLCLWLPLFKNAVENSVDQYARAQLSPYAHDEFKSRWLGLEASQALWVIAYASGYVEVLFEKIRECPGG